MPPKPRITEEMIIEAGFEIVRMEGWEKLTVRHMAEVLHCSTQPVLYNFPTAEALRKAVYQRADQYHSDYILPKGRPGMNPLTELGVNYVCFAREETQLFRFLFQTNQFSGLKLEDLLNDPQLSGILQMVAAGAKTDSETAKEMFLTLFITAHGCACLLAGNAMEYEEEKIITLLNGAFYRAKEKG